MGGLGFEGEKRGKVLSARIRSLGGRNWNGLGGARRSQRRGNLAVRLVSFVERCVGGPLFVSFSNWNLNYSDLNSSVSLVDCQQTFFIGNNG